MRINAKVYLLRVLDLRIYAKRNTQKICLIVVSLSVRKYYKKLVPLFNTQVAKIGLRSRNGRHLQYYLLIPSVFKRRNSKNISILRFQDIKLQFRF